MKKLHALLLISASLFLLSLAARNFGVSGVAGVENARAQTGENVYEGPPIVFLTMDDGLLRVIDADGYLWYRGTLPEHEWVRTARVFPPGTPIPNASESVSSFKSRFSGE